MAAIRLIDGRYLVERELGRGGMGVVFLAEDIGLRRKVALKLVEPNARDLAASVEHMRHEASSLASIRSEHIVQVYAFGTHLTACYFAMEYVNGPTLNQLVDEHRARGQSLALYRAINILLQVASGLDRIHAKGLVHRDVKPSNIVIERDSGRPVLIDFGLSINVEGHDEGASVWGGTPLYMAPEQTGLSKPTPLTARADIYALACTAFEVLTGVPPFLGSSAFEILTKHSVAPPPRPSEINPALAPFDAVLARGLAKDPADRYATASKLIEELGAARRRFRGALASDDFSTSSVMHVAAPAVAHDTDVDPESATYPAEAIHALVVDDDDSFRKFACRAAQLALHGRPMRVRVASSGEEAVASAKRQMPRLLLLDFDMPGMSGIETLARIRALPGSAAMRVLVISARAGLLEKWHFDALGVREFLDKPVALASLVARVASMAASA